MLSGSASQYLGGKYSIEVQMKQVQSIRTVKLEMGTQRFITLFFLLSCVFETFHEKLQKNVLLHEVMLN